MRPPCSALLSLLVLGAILPGFSGCAASKSAARKGDPIVRVWTEFRDAESFAQLGEYRTPEVEPGDAVILRSQAAERTGFYFSVRLQPAAGAATVPDGRLVLTVVAPDAAQPQSYEFPFTSAGRRSLQLLVGLTGTDWPHGNTMPLAWEIQILDTAGNTVAGRQSYLWAQP